MPSTTCGRVKVKVRPGPADVPPPEELAKKPRYQAELYTIFGRKQADDFLNPQTDQKKVVKVNPKLQQQGGRVGARVLWGTLRKDSHSKLLEKDRKIPESLKRSYGAFVRELVIQRGGVPVQRSFYAKDDVPELSVLLDKTRSLTIADRHHKRELMARSSRTNQDTTQILAHNRDEGQPELKLEKDIGCYLPTWVEGEEDDHSIASYQKWLSDSVDPNDYNDTDINNDSSWDGSVDRFGSPVKGRPIIAQLGEGSMADITRPLSIRRDRRAAPFPRLRFLTEEGSREAGDFTKRFEDHHLPAQHQVAPRTSAGQRSSVSVLEKSGSTACTTDSADGMSRLRHPRQTSAPVWEPLTFTALTEYSLSKAARGEGKFHHGKTRMFPLTLQEGASAT